MANANFEKLVAKVDSTKSAYREAKAALDTAVADMPVGTTLNLDGIPHQVQDKDGKRCLVCLMSRLAIAAMRGETIPDRKPRKRRTKAEIEAAKTAAQATPVSPN